MAAAAVKGRWSDRLLAVAADPDRVAVLEVIVHVAYERHVDRMRVLSGFPEAALNIYDYSS